MPEQREPEEPAENGKAPVRPPRPKMSLTTRRTLLVAVLGGGAAGALAGAAAGREKLFGLDEYDLDQGRPLATAASGLIADGATDNAQLLNDLVASAAEGTVITLPPGVLLIASRLRMRSGITLVGADFLQSTIRLADGANGPFVLLQEISSVTVHGIRFDGGAQKPGEVALQIQGCSDVVVEECAFERMAPAIHTYGAGTATGSNVTIARNSFSKMNDFAVRVSDGCDSVTIRDNTVTDVQKVSAPSPAAFSISAADVSVVGNIVESSIDTGVMVAGETAKNVSVSENVLSTTLVGIFVGSGANGVRVSGNRISSAKDFGIHVFDSDARPVDATVSTNQVITSGKTGIQIEGVSELTVTANVVSDPGTRSDAKPSWRGGIVATATTGGPPSHLSISSNVISSSASNSVMPHGILIESAGEDLYMQGNVIRGAASAEVVVPSELRAPYYVETATQVLTSRTTSAQ